MESHIERHVDNEELEVIQDADLNMPNEHEDYNEHREAMFDYEFSEDEDNDGGHGVIEVDINEEDTRIQIEDDNGLSDYEPVSEYASLIDLDDDDARHALEVSFNIEVPNLQEHVQPQATLLYFGSVEIQNHQVEILFSLQGQEQPSSQELHFSQP
ncbi:PREDICTED: uncharacterized protein LOC104593595 [Nelumbo nucifera]|uniref:Uncharacterized protein LOC104593595 n=1 Tax=Nelumbo nucifera TaxID=4432 RepID=A0A1U7ZSJ3_NELNU|nr:PREDICTED: uncharacterized protein LOC104593595 [Nelumbo nucifera]